MLPCLQRPRPASALPLADKAKSPNGKEWYPILLPPVFAWRGESLRPRLGFLLAVAAREDTVSRNRPHNRMTTEGRSQSGWYRPCSAPPPCPPDYTASLHRVGLLRCTPCFLAARSEAETW